MRGSVMGSGMVHVALMVVLFIVRGPAALIVPGPEVVQVALIDPTATAPVPAPAETPPPEPKLEEVKPVEEPGVKLQPKKPKPQPKRETPERPKASESPTLPSAKVGNAGLSGDVAVDAGDFEFTYYLVLIRNKIASNWTPPSGLTTSGQPIRSVVYFKVGRGGELSDVRLETGSGIDFFDRSALRAVLLSDPMPPLPLGFSRGELGIHFGFQWESP